MLRILSNRRLKKEITESIAAVRMMHRVIESSFTEAEAGCVAVDQDHDGAGLLIFDICSGKGFTGMLLAALYPNAEVIMVDSNTKMDMQHCDSALMANCSFHRCDVNGAQFEQFIHSRCARAAEQGKLPIALAYAGLGLDFDHVCSCMPRRRAMPPPHVVWCVPRSAHAYRNADLGCFFRGGGGLQPGSARLGACRLHLCGKLSLRITYLFSKVDPLRVFPWLGLDFDRYPRPFHASLRPTMRRGLVHALFGTHLGSVL